MTSGIDLHIHSVFSDGLHTPADIVALSRQANLHIISITDHDTVDGIAGALQAAGDTELTVIPGLEISANAGSLEIHILGYFVDHTDPHLNAALARFGQSRLERGQEIVAKLRAMGIRLSWDRVRELAGEGVVGRPHIALALQEAGYVGSSQEAFERYLGRNKSAYVPRLKMKPQEAIALILDANGVPVVAHPADIAFTVPELAAAGLAGIEVYYPFYSHDTITFLRQLAQEHYLICTGGSDFHGLALLPDNRLGSVCVPASCVTALCARRQHLRARAG